ncbi:hypothetical protein Tco_1060883 [Tanacetum coccineum]
MQDKLNQFKRLDVWELVARLADGNVIKSTRESYEDFVRSSSNDSNLSEYFVATVAHKTYHDFAQIGMVKWGRAWSMFPVAEVGGVLGAEMCCGAQREEGVTMIARASGGIQFLGEKLVSWSSKKQDCTAMPTTEVEYISLSAYCAQVIWMRTQLLDYGYHYTKIPMYYDSKSAIAISCDSTEYQLADLFTKALPKERFEYLVHRIGMRCMTPIELEHLAKLSY